MDRLGRCISINMIALNDGRHTPDRDANEPNASRWKSRLMSYQATTRHDLRTLPQGFSLGSAVPPHITDDIEPRSFASRYLSGSLGNSRPLCCVTTRRTEGVRPGPTELNLKLSRAHPKPVHLKRFRSTTQRCH
jgi:hypothetical protein